MFRFKRNKKYLINLTKKKFKRFKKKFTKNFKKIPSNFENKITILFN